MMKLCILLSLLLGQCALSAQSAIFGERIEEGSNIIISCENEGRVTWSKHAYGKRKIIFTAEQGKNPAQSEPDPDPRYSVLANLSLVINETLVSDSGIYFCNATPVVELTVIPLKAIFGERIEEGSNIIISCENEGRVSWSKHAYGKRKIIFTAEQGKNPAQSEPDPDPRYSVLANLSLVINETLVSDSGIYFCNATPVVELTVIPLKEIFTGDKSESAMTNTGVCAVERVPYISLAALFFSLLTTI
ncbi:uncharacterized protein LOC132875055 isoform X2 [Neoarius graeffei]|nr:uncharacterized protein LOC132875055 isoform X2 [Neoarius graeffei]